MRYFFVLISYFLYNKLSSCMCFCECSLHVSLFACVLCEFVLCVFFAWTLSGLCVAFAWSCSLHASSLCLGVLYVCVCALCVCPLLRGCCFAGVLLRGCSFACFLEVHLLRCCMRIVRVVRVLRVRVACDCLRAAMM